MPSNLFLTLLRCSFRSIDPMISRVASVHCRFWSCAFEIEKIDVREKPAYIVGVLSRDIPRCISFAIRKAARMESDIIHTDYCTRAVPSLLITVRFKLSGSLRTNRYERLPLEFFGIYVPWEARALCIMSFSCQLHYSPCYSVSISYTNISFWSQSKVLKNKKVWVNRRNVIKIVVKKFLIKY